MSSSGSGFNLLRDSIPVALGRGRTGRKTIGATATQITTSTASLISGVHIRAAGANTGTIYVGFASTVTADGADATSGFPLNANDGLFVPVEKMSELWLIGSAASQKFFWLAK
jgi:hypothetical protein